MERAVLEARYALESAGHQVCIVWRELSLRQEMLVSTGHQLCIVWRELFLKQEMPLKQPVIRCVLFFETAVLETRNAPKADGHHVCIVF